MNKQKDMLLTFEQLQKSGLKRVESRELRRYRQFYQLYPQIREGRSSRSFP